MARIEHVALWVRDLDASCTFYAKFFGAVPGMLYENRAKGFASRFVTFESGARLETAAAHEPTGRGQVERVPAGLLARRR